MVPGASRSEPANNRQAANRLGCVAVPLLDGDLDETLAAVLDLWADPRFWPLAAPRDTLPQLLIVVNAASDERLAQVRGMVHARPVLSACFAGVTAVSAGLDGDRDLYLRDETPGSGSFGRRAGPNFLFQSTMQHASAFGGMTLQIELDCLPVQAGWIEATEAVLSAHPGAWVIGSLFSGSGTLSSRHSLHLNGNALYRTGDPAFCDFLDTIWMPRLMALATQDANIAYDCWWSTERSMVDVLNPNEAWRLVRTYDSFFHNDPFVVNLLEGTSALSDFAIEFDRFDCLGRPPVFFHGSALKPLIRELLQNPSESIFDAINRIAPDTLAERARPLRRADWTVCAAQSSRASATNTPMPPPPADLADTLSAAGLAAGLAARALLCPDDPAIRAELSRALDTTAPAIPTQMRAHLLRVLRFLDERV